MTAQIQHYENKLAFEIDPSDLFDAVNNGEKLLPSMPENHTALTPNTSQLPLIFHIVK
jgi:hypothetical protein